MSLETTGPTLSEEGPFKADVKWKEGVTDEQKQIVADTIANIFNAIHPEAREAVESITLSPVN